MPLASGAPKEAVRAKWTNNTRLSFDTQYTLPPLFFEQPNFPRVLTRPPRFATSLTRNTLFNTKSYKYRTIAPFEWMEVEDQTATLYFPYDLAYQTSYTVRMVPTPKDTFKDHAIRRVQQQGPGNLSW